MDILLAHGYYLYDDPHELQVMKPYPPLGILYISAYLKSRGFHVGVFDATFARPADFVARLAQDRPSVVGLYCNLMTKFNILTMIRQSKAAGAVVVLGGPEPPYYAEEYLLAGADVIVIGEGELTLQELLPHLSQHGPHRLQQVNGIAYRDEDGKLVRTPARPYIPQLDVLPHPDRHAIDLPAYIRVWQEHHGLGSVSLICARGCPYTCAWCSHSVYGESHRRRSPENVVQEVELIREMYNPGQLWYADDVFTIHRSWFLKYAGLLKQRHICLPFECISRPDRLDADVIDALAEMGCYRVWIGSESGSQKVIDEMLRKVKIPDVQAKTRMLQQRGIQAGMFIMLGYEGEDIPQLEETVDHLKRSNPDIFLTTVAYPIKGTRYWNRVQERVITDKPWEQRTDRDLTVAGRHSRRFYSFTTRWMVGEVSFHKLKQASLLSSLSKPSTLGKGLVKLAKAFVNARVGRLGMLLTRREVEGGFKGKQGEPAR
ncbi:MAG: B12-binding domain-containing radical SAM protein [Chloroflexi bacterium]|nr:B12-binding domain-containing radical SAM protein [Chloroflexota bacterium]